MNYGRDYGNRNFLDRAAHTVRGWLGHRGGHSGYDNGYRGDMHRGGWDESHGGYRETGDVNGGYRNWQGGMEHGYGAANPTGRNVDWNRGMGAGGGYDRGSREEYRTGGYQPQHGSWDVDWDDADRTMPRGGMNRSGFSGGMLGSAGSYDRGYRQDYDRGMRGGMNRGGMSGGMMGRGMQGGMNRYDREDYGRYNQNQGGGGGYATGMLGGDAGLGDVDGGTIGNYGPYGGYGIERFRNGNSGGVQPGQYWTGYGHGSGYR